MNAINLGAALLVPTVMGFLVVDWFLRGSEGRYGFAEKLALGFGLGTGLLTTVMFIMGLLHIPYGVAVISAVPVVVSAVFAYLFIRRPKGPGQLVKAAATPPAGPRLQGIKLYVTIGLVAWLLLKVSFVYYECMTRPIFGWDAWSHWSTGAKIFYYNRGLLLDRSSEFFFGSGYRFLGHPVHTPLLQAWAALWLGEFHEVYVKAWSFYYFLALIVLFYSAVKRESSAFFALVAVFFLAGAPLLTYHGTEAYADLPLGYYALASTALLWGYIRRGEARLLVLAGLFGAMCVLTKNEGVFFLAALFSALVLYTVIEKRALGSALPAFLAPVAALAGPWFVFKFANGLGFGHGGGESALTWFSDPKYAPGTPGGLHLEVLPVILDQLFFGANFGLVFPFTVFLTLFYAKTVLKTDIRYLYLVMLLVFAMFVLTYLVFEATAVIELTGVNRNTLSYAPIVFFACAVLLARVRRGPPASELGVE